MKIGASFFPMPGRVAALARRAEEIGLDTVTFGDSPVLAGELMVALAEASAVTSRICVSSGVTNTVTRHVSIIASGFSSLQLQSAGRIVCGIGRGDSAVRHIGQMPAKVDDFAADVATLRSLLAGAPVPGPESMPGGLASVQELQRRGLRPVPLEIASTGPRTRAVAVAHADRIALGTGSDPVFVAAAVAEVEAALAAVGRSRDEVQIGAYLPAGLHRDRARARMLAGYITAKFANFAAMRGQGSAAQSGIPERLATLVAGVGDGYSYTGDPGANLADSIPAELVEWMALVGDADQVVARIRDLAEAGLDYVTLMTGFHQLDPTDQDEMFDLLAAVQKQFN